MNKFRILGVIAIIAIIANFFGGLDENWRDFKKGFEDGHNSAMEIYEPGRHIIPHHATSVKLNVEPLPETTVDSLSNNRVDWTLPNCALNFSEEEWYHIYRDAKDYAE